MRGVHAMGRVFLNPVVADTCSHPKAALSDGREHRSGSQAENHTVVKRVRTVEKPAALSLHGMKGFQVILACTN